MNKYQDKESSMDDYSHERKLRIDGRYEAAKGKMAAAENDFDHAHALKKMQAMMLKTVKAVLFIKTLETQLIKLILCQILRKAMDLHWWEVHLQ